MAKRLNEDDYVGRIYGRLKILKFLRRENGKVVVLCECQCENKTIKETKLSYVKTGSVRSCGCLKKKNYVKYKNCGDYYEGKMTDGKVFMIDIEDYSLVNSYGWHTCKGYVKAKINNKVASLHRFLLNETNPKNIVDHEDRNPLNNRRYNLRVCTSKDNARNRKVVNKFGVSGISKKPNGYEARIHINGKKTYLGYRKNLNDIILLRLSSEIIEYGEEFAPNRHLFKEYDIFIKDVSLNFKLTIYAIRYVMRKDIIDFKEAEDVLISTLNILSSFSDYELSYIKKEIKSYMDSKTLSEKDRVIKIIPEELLI